MRCDSTLRNNLAQREKMSYLATAVVVAIAVATDDDKDDLMCVISVDLIVSLQHCCNWPVLSLEFCNALIPIRVICFNLPFIHCLYVVCAWHEPIMWVQKPFSCILYAKNLMINK